jgi:chemotaxis protein methyltransferase CheR
VAALASLPAGSEEWQRLAGRLRVGETYFFRDRETCDALLHEVLPRVIAERRARGDLRLRLWSAGCATGEEPYTLAILLHHLLPDLPEWTVRIAATDVDPDALAAARRGEYSAWALRELPAWARERYFERRERGGGTLAPEIRRMVTFSAHNLAGQAGPAGVAAPAGPPAFGLGAMDVVLCRNVVMYFTPEARAATVRALREALVDGGWLVLSPAEASPELMRPLVPVRVGGTTLHRRERAAVAPPPRAAAPPAAAPPRPDPLAEAGGLERAAELCRAALEQDRLDPDAQLLLAFVHKARGDAGAALEAVRAAIYLAPDSAPAHCLHGLLLLGGGEAERGRRSLQIAGELLDAGPAELEPAP